jgi:hypothetical protein
MRRNKLHAADKGKGYFNRASDDLDVIFMSHSVTKLPRFILSSRQKTPP